MSIAPYSTRKRKPLPANVRWAARGLAYSVMLPSTELYISPHGIQLALQFEQHEKDLLKMQGSVAAKCMDQMLLVSALWVALRLHSTRLF